MRNIVLVICLSVGLAACNYFVKDENIEACGEPCCEADESVLSDSTLVTCPYCGYQAKEELPDDVCVIKYNCESCDGEMTPDEGDCCVFCTYGTHKCPSMQ